MNPVAGVQGTSYMIWTMTFDLLAGGVVARPRRRLHLAARPADTSTRPTPRRWRART